MRNIKADLVMRRLKEQTWTAEELSGALKLADVLFGRVTADYDGDEAIMMAIKWLQGAQNGKQ